MLPSLAGVGSAIAAENHGHIQESKLILCKKLKSSSWQATSETLMTSNGPKVCAPKDPAGNAECPGSGPHGPGSASHELDLAGSRAPQAEQSSQQGATVINGHLLEAASVSTPVCGMPQAHAGGDITAHPCGEASDIKELGTRNIPDPQVNAQVSSFRYVASELVLPEAPNRPIRAAPRGGTYCDAARSCPSSVWAIAHQNRLRPKQRPERRIQWRPLLMMEKQGLPAGYKVNFTGHCFRCLGHNHKLVDCHDPLRCLACRRNGHHACDYPEKKAGLHRSPIHSRLTFPKPIHSCLNFHHQVTHQQPAPSIQSRLVFLPLTPQKEKPAPAKESKMTWYPGMSENRPAWGNAVIITSVAMTAEATRLRSRAVLLVARSRPENIDIGIGDVSRIVAGCVRMPASEMRTMRHRAEYFMIVFDHPHQRTLALRLGGLHVKGVFFNIIPW